MPKWDLLDEAEIEAPPERVYAALLDYCAGTANWWRPQMVATSRGGAPPDELGAVVDVRVGRLGLTRFAARVVDVVPGTRLCFDYFEGGFTGQATWEVHSVEGGTRLSLRWQMSPRTRLMRAMSRFVDVGKIHRDVMRVGFDKLRRHLELEGAQPSKPGAM
jgi:uncharacterized protein YndB with AHSA1/START domain